MSEKIKIHWVTQEHNIPGNALGYNSHNANMKKHCEKYFDFDDNADIALTITPADNFIPVKNKKNILFTMWEFDNLPNSYISKISRADALIVPCAYCRDVFRPMFNGPIYVCHEGINPERFPFMERSFPRKEEKFRFLWVGAPNPRKGYNLVLEVTKVLSKIPNIEIYMKTTTPDFDRKIYVSNLWRRRKQMRAENRDEFKRLLNRKEIYKNLMTKYLVEGEYKNIIWDARKLDFNELMDLYRSAHCFILPTFGEGWGLTLSEAMATGAPCIATPITGCSEYFDETVGYPISYRRCVQEVLNYDLMAEGSLPETQSLLNNMVFVIKNYDDALKKGKRASSRMHNKFTWDMAAERLLNIIRELSHERIVA